jgi:iron complex outermembrane receptor protein
MRVTALKVRTLALVVFAVRLQAQESTLRVEVRLNGSPVAAVAVEVNGREYQTDERGTASVTVPAGPVEVVVVKEGFARASTSFVLGSNQERTVTIDLEPLPTFEERVTVSATRTGGRLDDQPMRVEVIEREEIEEKLLMTPGDIVMMLNEMGGMRVQATSPSLGAASVRVQGMRGRFTRFLAGRVFRRTSSVPPGSAR